MTKISIVIPVYNVEKYLKRCLDSVLNQSFADWEAICVDDGSTDDSAAILADFTHKDKRFKVITQKNQGIAVARNNGLKTMTGQYVTFLDSDDRLPNYALKLMLQIAVQSEADIVVSTKLDREISNPKIIPIYKLHTHPLRDFVSDRHIFSSACNRLYKADMLKKHNFVGGICFEDWVFNTVLFGQIRSYASTDIPCYIYTTNNVSTTRSQFSEKKATSYIVGIRSVYTFYKDKPELPLAQKRMAVAIKMCVGKVYKSKDKTLQHLLLSEMQKLFDEKVISIKQLSLKTRFRLWRMR